MSDTFYYISELEKIGNFIHDNAKDIVGNCNVLNIDICMEVGEPITFNINKRTYRMEDLI